MMLGHSDLEADHGVPAPFTAAFAATANPLDQISISSSAPVHDHGDYVNQNEPACRGGGDLLHNKETASWSRVPG